jgi:BirA family transcriptional regulator, biotin operon repressor / biotin---[acetyl-CoA-carboxylase] ligase
VLSLPGVVLYDEVPSTLDIVHSLGDEGAPAGMLVLADAQSAGRGRLGRSWHSEPGRGIWLTLLERPHGDETLSVLSLRIALALAPALDPFVAAPVRLKWPNDVYVGARKLAGVLLEARWRGARLDWLAVGVGINVQPPRGYEAASLAEGTERVAVLRAVVPGLRHAVATTGPLTPQELSAFGARDLAIGETCELPAPGRVAGIDAHGALLVDTAEGRSAFHGGSLVLATPSATR